MIAVPAGWSAAWQEQGLTIVPPAGPSLGTIRYAERLRPLRGARAVVAELVGDQAAASVAIERLVTREGEHAAFAICDGERSVGLVFGDDFYARVAGTCRRPEEAEAFAAVVRELTLADVHLLGVRRRRFVYTPPEGWHGLAQLFEATWYPTDYPLRDLALTVTPAVPAIGGLAHGLLAATAGDASPERALLEPARELELPSGLHGTRWRVALSGERESLLAVLEDGRYVYAVRIDHAGREGLEAAAVLERLLASIEPVPKPGADDAGIARTLLGHWEN